MFDMLHVSTLGVPARSAWVAALQVSLFAQCYARASFHSRALTGSLRKKQHT